MPRAARRPRRSPRRAGPRRPRQVSRDGHRGSSGGAPGGRVPGRPLSRPWSASRVSGTTTVRRGLEELAALRRAGVRVVLVEGNRDFFLDAPTSTRFAMPREWCTRSSPAARRFLLEHGDLINRRDRLYRFWRAVSKSARRPVVGAPAPSASGPAHRARHRGAAVARPTSPIGAACRSAISTARRRHFAAGVDIVLWGHFHREWRFEGSGGMRTSSPGGSKTGTVAWVDDDGSLAFEAERSEQFVDSDPVRGTKRRQHR